MFDCLVPAEDPVGEVVKPLGGGAYVVKVISLGLESLKVITQSCSQFYSLFSDPPSM